MVRSKRAPPASRSPSNAVLIALKLAAGALTGSIAIITEAVHSLIDLVASVIAYFSIRAADEPADAEHPYGHEKVENLAAAIEGMLILVGAVVIVYEATHQLVVGSTVERLGIGIAVMGFSVIANLTVSSVLSRQAKATEFAGARGRRRPPAYRRDDLGWGSSVSLWFRSPATPPSTRSRRWSSRSRSSGPGSGSCGARPRCWSTKRCRTRRWTGSRRRSPPPVPRRSPVYHKLRAAGRSRRHIDLHVQYRSGTSLERAHELGPPMRAEIEAEIPQAEVADPC